MKNNDKKITLEGNYEKIVIYVSDELNQEMSKACEKAKISRTTLIRLALNDFLKKDSK